MVQTDLEAFWSSIANELGAAKDRVRNLIGAKHWQTDGTHKEIILRNVIKRYLPETLKVCTGFVYKSSGAVSTQIDLLIINRSCYTLFKEGDLVIVTPHAVRGIIEVKTRCEGTSELKEVLARLARNQFLADEDLVQNRGRVWAGLFIYESDRNNPTELLQSLSEVDKEVGKPIDCIACGPDMFAQLDMRSGSDLRWISYDCPGLSAGCFVMDMLGSLTRNLGLSDFRVLSTRLKSVQVKPVLQIKRGEKSPSPFSNSTG